MAQRFGGPGGRRLLMVGTQYTRGRLFVWGAFEELGTLTDGTTGFFNLVVYMFPRIQRYFKEVPLTQSFKRTKSSFFSSLKNTVRKRRRSTQAETQVSCDEGNVESGEKGAALEVDVDVGDKEEGEGMSGENKIGEGDSSEDDEGDGEKDAIDELECVVEA
eukprot:scaffold12646_cov146-Skeletonema_dohrnii-CCMP3373.AAC.6